MKVLFVCTANICRSPFMEQYARATAGHDALVCSSAGTHGFDGAPMDTVMANQLTQRGIGMSDFASRPITPSILNNNDLILTAESAHRKFILADHAAAFKRVFTVGQFAKTLERLDPADLADPDLIEIAANERVGDSTEHDIADPFRQGDAAAAVAADRITGLLDQIVPVLRNLAGEH